MYIHLVYIYIYIQRGARAFRRPWLSCRGPPTSTGGDGAWGSLLLCLIIDHVFMYCCVVVISCYCYVLLLVCCLTAHEGLLRVWDAAGQDREFREPGFVYISANCLWKCCGKLWRFAETTNPHQKLRRKTSKSWIVEFPRSRFRLPDVTSESVGCARCLACSSRLAGATPARWPCEFGGNQACLEKDARQWVGSQTCLTK